MVTVHPELYRFYRVLLCRHVNPAYSKGNRAVAGICEVTVGGRSAALLVMKNAGRTWAV